MTGLSSEGYAAACAAGRDHADILVQVMLREDNPCILVAAVREIAERGTWSGREIGFVTGIAIGMIGCAT